MELIAKVKRENESIQFIRISNKGMFVEIEYTNLPALSFILTNTLHYCMREYK